jgi:hypothetical protein
VKDVPRELCRRRTGEHSVFAIGKRGSDVYRVLDLLDIDDTGKPTTRAIHQGCRHAHTTIPLQARPNACIKYRIILKESDRMKYGCPRSL